MNTKTLLGMTLALVLFGPIVAASAQATRLWVDLPRAERIEETADFPFPPPPTVEALERRARRGRPDRVAVLRRGPTLEALRAVEATGARILRVSRWFSAVSVEADASARARLAETFGSRALRPVARLIAERKQPERVVELAREVPAAGYGLSRPQITQIGLDRLHARGLSGEGVRVLVLDTGFRESNPAIAGVTVEAAWDFVNDDADVGNDPGELDQQDRHGTGVTGVIGGFVPGDLIGGARGVRFLWAKTERLDTEIRAEEDAFVAALEWGEALGADVMNASLGYRVFYDDPDSFAYEFEDLDGDTARTTRAVDDLVALGVVAVTSAGNRGADGPGSLLTPADADSSIAVGAVDTLGTVTAFSSRGPTFDGRIKPDVVALGQRVRWALNGQDSGTGWASGTSLSSPLVASVAALVLEAHPDWGPGRVSEVLRTTASRSSAPDNDVGWGVVDAEAAVFGVEAPEHPLPFATVHPDDGARVPQGVSVDFRWRAAEDLQTPDALDYRIEFSADDGFGSVGAIFEAGSDTSASVVISPVGTTWWRVVARDPDGHLRVGPARSLFVDASTAIDGGGGRPWARWEGPWPNPARDVTTVRLALDRAVDVESIAVFDLAGRRVRTLRGRDTLLAGGWLFQWDGRDAAGGRVASGVYLIRGVVRDRTGERFEAVARVLRLR